MPRGVKKTDLPEKVCVACGRPFTWRRKWARVWDEVRYCSDRCRSLRGTSGGEAKGGRSGEPPRKTRRDR
ncbi:DUF2256 domain-containing protein [Aliigemmobacter aestuarii]|uniref:DUF2256 domain-containing protein n=1 Tax=Aliigemmobacter aestuarii TaxID=1445661 RepID=A0A4S3MJY9_9RHOB|nr:DUF2256 domain-containing protein [Gemmobacter aestuarii]